ncbi:MAG TPA: hypothetical protein ENJ87_12600 [Gammaproteobacteria bacterium]|nr:hypothetical protein [Gammaproteobacteria bacterium]
MRLLFIIVFLFASPVNCLAGYLGGGLQEKINSSNAGDEIPVIVYFRSNAARSVNGNINVDNLKSIKRSDFRDRKAFKRAYKEARKMMRKQRIEAMKSEADFSNKQFRRILRTLKKKVDHDLWLINGLAVKLPAYLITTLSNQARVDHIDLDRVIKLSGHSVSTSTSPPTWNLDAVKSSLLNAQGYSGEGIVIASMDTGVDYLHPDLAASWRGGSNSWFDPYAVYTVPHDGVGHGTQVMGVMVGGDASGNKLGVAPGAHWIAVKIFTDNESATVSAIHSGFQWLLDPDGNPGTDDAPDIVNNSWGSTTSPTTCDPEFHADIDALKQAGIEVVFAAGNGGPFEKTLYSPADYAQVVSVGSVDEFMTVANTSSRGASDCSNGFYPNLVAPGVGIYTSDLSQGLGTLLNPFITVEGTSFAAPHLTATIALLKGAVPTATHTEIRNALYASATDLGSPGPDNITGYGMLDGYKALLKLRCPAGTTDTDGDGWYDACDNCIASPNKLQADADADGYGNACDADLNNDNIVNTGDIPLFFDAFVIGDLTVDFNEDGIVNTQDIPDFARLFFDVPGPSALVP